MSQLLSRQSTLEPGHQFSEANLPSGNGHNQIINGFVVRNIQPVSTTADQDLHKEPGCSLVTIHEAVVADHAVKDGRGLLGDGAVVA